jgi:type II secretory pathway pseudopilin PulG
VRPLQRRQQRGFSYLLALALIAIVGYGLAQAGIWWKTEAQRQREAELLFVGAQYKQAIAAYQAEQDVPRYPRTLDDLLEDNRFTDTRRHLRKLWPDPLSPKTEWGLIIDPETDGIAGIYSQAAGVPLKQANFPKEFDFFKDAPSYASWRFFVPPPPPPGEAANQGDPGGNDQAIGGLQDGSQPGAEPAPNASGNSPFSNAP